MLMEVQDFCRRVGRDLHGLIAELQQETGRLGSEEYEAWEASLSSVAHVLDNPLLRDFHVHVGQRGGLAVEYRLPATSSWCDLVLLGHGLERPTAVIVELKNWDTYGDDAGPTESLVWHKGQLELHPSDQVRGYTEYCRNFHSTVLDVKADVSGCVYFTWPQSGGSYLKPPHERLVTEYPVFTDSIHESDDRFPPYLVSKLHRPDAAFANAFEHGSYRQDRGFCEQIAAQIANPGRSPFVLLDHQRKAFELCRAKVRQALDSGGERKTVVIVEGPPGSGKSAVAARLWAELRLDQRLSGNDCVITTTSSSQRRNWKSLFEQTKRGSSWVVMPANQYAPADTRWVGNYKKKHGPDLMVPEAWRHNVDLCRKSKKQLAPTDAPLVSIVDEAHALINPEHPKARTPAGWPVAFGPQAWHIIRASRVAVFLMDYTQSFRDRETTTREDIQAWAAEYGAELVPRVSLAGLQFRAAGFTEYTDWVDHLLGLRADLPSHPSWRRSAQFPDGRLIFEVVRDPLALEEAMRPHLNQGETARLLATYGRPWLTDLRRKGASLRPHALAPSMKDFDFSFKRDGKPQRWSRIWNYVPREDYTFFIQAPPGSPMADDPLCEIGCPYVVRGFDFDWVGLLWLKDLVWRKDRWVVNLEHIHETGIVGTLREARRERKNGRQGPSHAELLRRTKQAYRILLTRAMRGVYVWFEDEETRLHMLSLLASAGP